MYRNLLSSPARVQVPWIKVTLGEYTFGVFSKDTLNKKSNEVSSNYKALYSVQYPNYVKSLNITKINGQINQYTLNISYPITANDDPNFFDKVLSSVSKSRKIVFSYGDMSTPSFSFRDEEAIITKVYSPKVTLIQGTWTLAGEDNKFLYIILTLQILY